MKSPSRLTHNHQKLKTTQMSINRWRDKQNVCVQTMEEWAAIERTRKLPAYLDEYHKSSMSKGSQTWKTTPFISSRMEKQTCSIHGDRNQSSGHLHVGEWMGRSSRIFLEGGKCPIFVFGGDVWGYLRVMAGYMSAYICQNSPNLVLKVFAFCCM